IDGVVVDERGVPRPTGIVTMSVRDAGNLSVAKSTTIRADGSFRLNGVPPGDYRLVCRSTATTPAEAPFLAMADVSLDGTDVQTLVLEPKTMVSVSGRVIMDSALARQVTPDSIVISSLPVGDLPLFGGQVTGRPREDWTFVFQSWPGTSLVRVSDRSIVSRSAGNENRVHVKA